MKKTINRRQFLKSTAALSTGLGISPFIAAGSNSVENKIHRKEGDDFVSLFDGKTLNGWHKTGGRWNIEDGAIVAEQDPPSSGNGGILLSDETYSDFELIIDVKPGWGCDSGIFLRSKPTGESYQVYVDYHDEPNDGGIAGFIYGQSTGGWRTEPYRYYGIFENDRLTGLEMKSFTPYKGYNKNPLRYACTKQEWKEAWKMDDFNTLRIRCEGKYPIITTWINETKICKFDAAGSENPDFDHENMYQIVGDKGHIALQVHGGDKWWADGAKVRWKNIKIREL